MGIKMTSIIGPLKFEQNIRTKMFYGQPKINVVSTLNFDVDLTKINWRCFNDEIRLSFGRYKKILNFQASCYKKITFTFDVDLPLINRRCFDVEIGLPFQR